MSMPDPARALENVRAFFLKTLECLSEEDSGFQPTPEALTVAQQVAHTAHTIDWFVEGAFSPSAFDENWEQQAKLWGGVASLAEAKAWFNRACDGAVARFGGATAEELAAPIAPNHVMGGPRSSVLSGIADHTAHHRGSLAVYARLRGKVPAMPYM